MNKFEREELWKKILAKGDSLRGKLPPIDRTLLGIHTLMFVRKLKKNIKNPIKIYRVNIIKMLRNL